MILGQLDPTSHHGISVAEAGQSKKGGLPLYFGPLCVGGARLAIGDHCTVIIVQKINYSRSTSSKLLLNIEKALEHSTKLKDDT